MLSFSLTNKILIFLVLVVLMAMCSAAPKAYIEDFPLPPVKPERFNSKEELKEYLVKLFTYYSIVERPRFGKRSLVEDLSEALSETGGEGKGSSIYESLNYRDGVPVRYIAFLIDENHDGFASGNEIYKFVHMFDKNEK